MRRAVVAGLFTVLFALWAPAGAVAQAAPSISLSLDAATIGQPVTVSGRGFPATTAVSVQLCGNQAANGTVDCDVLAGQTVVTDEVGVFRSQIVVRFPPVPCPCVVWATSNATATAAATAPIGVVAAPFTNPARADTATPAPQPGLEVVHASVRETQQWRSWLGLPSTAELAVTLRNPGDVAIEHPVLSLTIGKGADPAHVVASPDIDRIEAGADTTITVPIDLDVLTWGRLTVKGTAGSAQPVVFRAHVLVIPWLLGLVPIGAVIVPVTLHRRRRRRAGSRLDDTPLPAAVAVADGGSDGSVPIEPQADDEPKIEFEPVPDVEPEIEPEVELDPVSVASHHGPARVLVTFTWPMWGRADSVAVCGEFNDWSTESHRLTRLDNGGWAAAVEVDGCRTYRYKFFVDGERWENDWVPDALMPNDFGSEDSVVVVGLEDRYANITEQKVVRSNGNDRMSGLFDLRERDDDIVDLAALDRLAPTSADFWGEEPTGLWMKLRDRYR